MTYDAPLSYLIGADEEAIAPDASRLIEGPYDVGPVNGGKDIAYCNLFHEDYATEGPIYAPYLPDDDTSSQYGEGRVDPRGAGWRANLDRQYALRRAQGHTCVELDNPDSYAEEYFDAVLSELDLCGFDVVAKNPVILKDANALAYVLHPRVIGMIIEHNDLDPAACVARANKLRELTNKPTLPIWFVTFADGKAWGEAVAKAAKGYQHIGVTYSRRGEYETVVDLLPFQGSDMVWIGDGTNRLAKSLVVLYNQVDKAYPTRDKSSDGTIGDASHQATTSDHNPGPDHVVTALDITHDPAHGVDSYLLAENFLREKDERIKYIISNRKIASGSEQSNPAWVWRQYSGSNPHDMHVHISVKDPPTGDGETPWRIDLAPVPPVVIPSMPVIQKGSTGEAVEKVQELLMVDGVFGPATEAAVKDFQKANGLVADGIVGPYTWRALLKEEIPPSDEDWIDNVTATVFGGASDPNTSAYDGKMLNDTDLYVALPDRFEGNRPMVEVRHGNTTKTASIEDVGPWCTNDDYWNKDARPLAETCYAAQAPLPNDSGPNRGKVPKNDAGIDLSPALAQALGISGKGKVSWRLVE